MTDIITSLYSDWQYVAPELLVIITALLIMLRELIPSKEDNSIWNVYITVTGLLASALIIIVNWQYSITYPFLANLIIDPVGDFFNLLFILSLLTTVIISSDFFKKSNLFRTDYLILLLGALLGFMIIAKANNLITLFIGLELFSISLYILCGFYSKAKDEEVSTSLLRRIALSQESALKYLLLGAFASAILLYGLALLYGASGTTNIQDIALYLKNNNGVASPMFLLGLGFFLVGFCFKLAVVPFHSWAPDVYEGAPTPITALMSFATKGALFAVGIHVLYNSLHDLYQYWFPVLYILAALSMLAGSVAALRQKNLKRMLAYSSISHAGFLLIPVVAFSNEANSSLLFYLLVYLLMNMGAFAVIMAIEHDKGTDDVTFADLRGLYKKHPLLAGTLIVFMLSLAGFPPTAGFIAKFYVFMTAINSGFYLLVVTAAVSSMISVYYYFKVIYYATSQEEDEKVTPMPINLAITSVALSFAVILFFIGINPQPITDLTESIVFF